MTGQRRLRPAIVMLVLLLGVLCGMPSPMKLIAEDNPATPEREKTWSPFGIGACHIHNRSAGDDARWVPQMTQIGVRHYRTVQSGWGAVEPKPGQWNWETLDQQMTYLESQKGVFGGFLIGNPGWNTKDARGSLPVNNLEGWSRYVSEVVKHCKGRITYWEVWNEPPNGTGRDQTAADYAKVVMAAYKAAKAADPDCVVVRRNVKNDPAKLTLTYESTTGYMKAEPYDIPDNQEWHTAKWRIDDAQFVNMWAYNFTMNSGSYVIQSVTVTKLEN